MSQRRKIAHSARRWKKATVPLILGAGLLVIVGLLAARPLHRRYQAAQAADSLIRAQSAADEKNWHETLRLCGETLRLQITPKAFLLAAEALTALQASPDEILETLQKARDMGESSPAVLLKIASAQIARGDLVAAQFALSDVPETARSTWQAIEVEGSLLLALGREREAAQRVRERLGADLSSPGATFRIAAIDSEDQTLSPDQRAAARRRLWEEARAQTTLSHLAIRLLARTAALTESEARELHRLAPPGSDLRFTTLGAVLRTSDATAQARFLAQESALTAQQPPEDQLRYLQCLAANQQPRALLAHLAQNRQRFPRLYLAEALNLELEALAQTQQWPLVLEKLQSRAARRFDPVLDNLWHACALHATRPGDPQIPLCLQTAYEATERGRLTAPTLRIAETAARLDQHDFAAQLYLALASAARLPAEKAARLQSACDSLAHAGDTVPLLSTARQLAALTPGHSTYHYRAAYLELLTAQPLEDILPRLETTETLDPAQTARQHLLWAMIHHRRGQRESLLKELNGLETATTWPPGERAVLSGLLATTGQTARAFALAEKVPASLLLPEEAKWLKLAR